MSEATGPPTPRAWVGDRVFPWPPTLGLGEGEEVVAGFTLVGITPFRAADNSPLLRLQLADCYGAVEAHVGADSEALMASLRPGMYVGVRGQLLSYGSTRVVSVTEIAPLHVELDDLVLFLPRSSRPAELMDAELAALIASVRDEPYQQLLRALLAPDSEGGRGFRLAPAAKQNHHAYLGGLIEHTISMTRVCDMLAAHYGGAIDRDLLITGALLHDIGKIREIGARSGFPYTDEGKLLGHILIGLQMVADTAAAIPGLSMQRLLLLQHLIASHQGRYEWQSPREPRTLEAVLLHYADDLDAKLHQAAALVAAVDIGWTAYDRNFGRDFFRHPIADSSRADRDADPASALRAMPLPTGGMPETPASHARRAELDNLDLFTDGPRDTTREKPRETGAEKKKRPVTDGHEA